VVVLLTVHKLVEQQHGMPAGAHHGADLGQVQVRRRGVAEQQGQGAPLPSYGQMAPKM
jgi:hypothetical protein